MRYAACLLALAGVIACAKDQQNTLAQDSALARDLARAGVDSLAQPELTDIPTMEQPVTPPPAIAPPASTPRPKQAAPRQAPPKPQPKDPAPTTPPAAPPATTGGNTTEPGSGAAEKPSGMIAAGSLLQLDALDRVCTNTSKVGDRMAATVTEPVMGSNGVSIPSGANVTLEVTELKRSENTNDQIVMGFRVIAVSFDGKSYPLNADVQSAVIDRVRASSTGNDAKKVVGGAVVGAVIGQVLGRGKKGTLVGAAAGAAAGGAAAAATANYEGCVNTGAKMVVKLNSGITVTS